LAAEIIRLPSKDFLWASKQAPLNISMIMETFFRLKLKAEKEYA
jgi:hypothetical protein